MLNKFTIIGIIIGSAISILGASSMATSLNSPNEIQEDTATFGVGDFAVSYTHLTLPTKRIV